MAGPKLLLKITVFTLFTIIYSSLNLVHASRLNVPRVLLPVFNNFPVNFTLEVTEGGCYQWSSSRLDVVQLIPMNENPERTCSSAVLVQSVTREPTRSTAIVLAKDINTGQFLRCDVIVDAINSLNLVTTTRELFIEDAPEAFEVRAHDEQGNEFTTLAGIEFHWTISNGERYSLQDDIDTGNSILRFMTFQESPYETPPTVSMLDATGKMGSIILLEGVKTGTARVSARLPHPEYKDVPSVEVELIVVANLIILPTDVTMMAHDRLKYKIMQVHQGHLEEIKLPSSQYYLVADSPQTIQIDNERSYAYALQEGKSKVLLHDKNVNEEYGIILPTATVHVNAVAYITITVLPNRNRGLILGHTHEIIVELFDAKDHKFHIGEGVEVSVVIDSKFLETRSITQNGTHIVGVPIACGATIVEAKLHGVIDRHGKRVSLPTPLTAKAELIIHTPVSVNPQILAVPWEPQINWRFDIALKATGGDGAYVWNTRQPSVATVTQNGVVRIIDQGSTDIVVSMARNHYNKDRARVHVMPPSRLEIIQYSMEAATGEPIHLHIALYGKIPEFDKKEVPFTDCRDTSFEVYITDSNFVKNTTEFIQPIGVACTTLTVIGTKVGSSSITVAYTSNEQYLTANVTVSAYEPLLPVHPVSGETLLAVGSSRKIVFKGGPSPWADKTQGFIRETSVTDDEIISIVEQENTSGQLNVAVFEVTCRALGDVILTFKVLNEPLLPNCRSTGAVSVVRVICGKPRHIYLQAEFKDSKNCPIAKSAEKVMAHNEKPLRLMVHVEDNNGRRFDNFTSLHVEWTLTPTTGGTIDTSGVFEETILDYNVQLPKNHYQRIVPKKHTGMLTITARISDYQKYILGKLRIAPEWPPFPEINEKGNLATPKIVAEINVMLVNDTIITPSKIKILNDPNVKYSLQVSQGSGYYEFVLSTNDIADIRYVEPTRTINVIPKKSGILQLALRDLCLVSTPAMAEIEVQQLAGIEVESINKVEKSRCITATVRLFDTNANVIELPSLDAFDIKSEIGNEFIGIKRLSPSEQGEAPYSRLLYLIQGLEEGQSQMTFASGHGEEEIRSESTSIEVFLPLKIAQKNLTVLVGTIYQVITTGGPSNARIEFSVDDEEVVTIDVNGIFEGRAIGNAEVVAKAVGFDSRGNRVIYSQDHLDIKVVQLEGVKIVIPTSRIKVGAIIPLWAFGIPDHLTPLIIGSMKSQLIFTWYTDPNYLHLHNMYEDTGISIRYQNEVTLRAKALKRGITTVYLNVTIPPKTMTGYKEITFNTFIKIEIIEELALIDPDFSIGVPVIRMTPNSSLKLRTNRDDNGVTTYKILMSGQTGESEESHALTTTKTVTIDKTGLIKSGETLGRNVLLITNTEAYNFKQSLTIVVEVKPIHYMMFSLSSPVKIRSGEELNILPKGMELNYIVDYFDSIGNKFHATDAKFRTAANRADLVIFTPTRRNEVSLKFHENGELVAKIYNEKYPMFDYAHMMIGDVIFPTKTILTNGDVVCFSMPLLSSESGDPGFWQSSDPDVLTVDGLTGIGRAKNPGHAVVKHSLMSSHQGEIEVAVDAISKISLVLLRGKNITGSEVFSVPLVLKSKDEGIKENNVLARGLGGCRTRWNFALDHFPFTCSIQFTASAPISIKDIFITKPRFDIVSGFYYCDVIPISEPTLISSTLETKIQINAQSKDVEGKPLDVSYIPAFFIKSNDIVFVQSDAGASTANVDVHGLAVVLETIEIEIPDGVIVNSQEISRNKLIVGLRLIQNREDAVQGQKLRFVSKLTKQNVSLLIRTSKYTDYVAISGIHWIDYIYYHRYTLLMFLVLVGTIIYVWKNKIISVDIPVNNANIFAEKCPPPLKQSPNQTASSINNSMSPRRSQESPLRPFSAFEPVYGDPRGFYTPTARRNISLYAPTV